MALDRFTNLEEIQETNGVVRGITWHADDLDILQLDLKTIVPEERPIVELHLYTLGSENRYITGGCIDDFEMVGDALHINYGKACQSLGIERGQFEVVVNVYKNLLGSKDEPDLYIKEISEDRRELWIKTLPNTDLDVDAYLDAFGAGVYAEKIYETRLNNEGEEEQVLDDDGQPIIKSIAERPLSDDIMLNFGDNKLYKVINQKDWNDENDFVVRLYEPLGEEFEEKANLWAVEQLSDSYIDNINLAGPGADKSESRKLLGPNFNIDVSKGTITETDFKSWNELLDANTSTSQQIIDRIFSGSMAGSVNIDYSGFQNWVHFSSAEERLKNFRYKLQLIEYYERRIVDLEDATGADDTSLQGNIVTNRERKDQIIGTFDGFERWMYNSPTSSLFSDQEVYSRLGQTDGIYSPEGGFLGAKKYRLPSWPKYLSDGKYILHNVTSSIAEDYYNGWITSASFFDNENNNSLVRTIPEHIRLDGNNSEYELFVNMIGHHFDILYSHIDNLTRIYKPEEHPNIGQSKETIYQVAQSLGWQLENGQQASQLWQYKLGVDSGSGAFSTTGSLFSKSNEAITTEVWRRITNNLPFLLKTKGTARSIKALMNTFGIPQTLLSIREYGGPKVEEDTPTIIEDRFNYALKFESGSHGRSNLKFRRTYYSSSIGGWGLSGYENNSFTLPANTGSNPIYINERPPDTIEFRFKPASASSMVLMSHIGTGNNVYWNLGIQHTGSFSGSGKYGRMYFEMRTYGGGANDGATISYTDYVPLYDGEFWNARLWTSFPFVTASHASATDVTPTIYFQTQKASDYIDDKVVHRTSGSLFPGSGSDAADSVSLIRSWAKPDESRRLVLGGETGSGTISSPLVTYPFSGSMQEYREWMEVLTQKTFDLHTTNPTSYVSGLSATSSYDTLVRHYPLGSDLNAVDHSDTTYLFITSSHPNSTITDFSPPYPDGANQYATASNFPSSLNTERGSYEAVEETYYIQGVSLGGNVPRSQKIRLESNQLMRRLSPKSTSERSRFDKASVDTNRLGLFYSAADQINKEIFNHIGDVALDDYIGDPDHEITFEYPDLSNFSKEYWKKYSDKNDINAYLRIFSQFDFTLFNQIKQLLPERVDEAMGLLVEPHALERAKVRLTKRPEKEPLHYEAEVKEVHVTASGDITPLSASIDMHENLLSMTSIYHKGTGGYIDTGNTFGVVSGSQGGIPGGDPYTGTVYKHIYTLFPYKVNPTSATNMSLPMEITGTLHPLTYSPTGSIIDKQRTSTVFKLDVLHFSGSVLLNERDRQKDKLISRSLAIPRGNQGVPVPSSYNYSRSLQETSYRDDFNAMTENQRYTGCRLSGPGINQSTTIAAIDQKPVIEIFETNPNTLIFNNEPNATNPGNLEVR